MSRFSAFLPSFRILLAIAVVLSLVGSSGSAQEDKDGSVPFAFEVKVVNKGLPPEEKVLRLDTPRATLES